MIRKKSVLLWLLTILLSGVLGGVAGGLIQFGGDALREGFERILRFMTERIPMMMALTVLLFCGGGLILFWLGRRAYARLKGDPEGDAWEKVDPLLDWSIVCNSMAPIGLFLFFALFIQQIEKGAPRQFGAVIVVFLAGALGAAALEVWIVCYVKKIHPGKRGDPLSVHFAKDWLQSCDELEKRVTYIAAYRTMTGLRVVLLLLMTVLLLLSIEFPVGLTPFAVIGVIWLYIGIRNIAATHKLTKGGNVE